MTKQLTSLFAILTICVTSYGKMKTETYNHVQNKNALSIDSSMIAILPFDTTLKWIFIDSKPTELTVEDFLKIDTLLNQCINEYNPEQEKLFNEINGKNRKHKLRKENFIIDLKGYKRQYIAVLNSKGEKEVWVNCFCETDNSVWKTKLILVDDGGNCYFNLKINLTTGKYYEFEVNGYA